MLKKLCICVILLLPTIVSAQEEDGKNAFKRKAAHKKGDFFAFWGWNHGAYTNSTIHFKGDDYNFKLHSVRAKDRQNKISWRDYFQLNRITIPQTNFRFGYFIKDNFAVSIGVDHMKYVMVQDQYSIFTGRIDNPDLMPELDDNNYIKLTEDFLTYEHTDGLNYINAEVEYYYNVYERKFFRFNSLVGAGIGFMLPKSNVKLMDKVRHDDFHFAGFGLDTKIGIETLFWDIFFLRAEGKLGYINMPSIRTSPSKSDKASQQIFFGEFVYAFGFKWRF